MKYQIKNLSFFLTCALIFSLFFVGCKSDASVDKKAAAEAKAEAEKKSATHVKSERAAVGCGFWHYSIVGGPKEEKDRYKGRWINVKRDDTFTSGLYDQQTNSGTWTFDDPTSTILLNYAKPDENLDNEWQVKGFGETTIWMGNTPNNPKATQIKMNKFEPGTYPTAE